MYAHLPITGLTSVNIIMTSNRDVLAYTLYTISSCTLTTRPQMARCCLAEFTHKMRSRKTLLFCHDNSALHICIAINW